MRVTWWSVLVLCVCEHACAAAATAVSRAAITSATGTSSPPATPTEDESTGLVDWLTRYGYLPPSDVSTGQLQAWTAVTQAVKAMQKYGGLEETGVADEETLRLMQTPRCSLPDEDRGSNHQSALYIEAHGHRIRRAASTWARRSINWRLRSYPASSALSRETIRSLVFYALRVWAEPTPLEFHEVGGPEGADLQVDFLHGSHGDGYPFDGAGGAVGHAFFPSDPDRAGGVHLDAEEEWAFRQPEGTDLFTVLVHELGHALGLSHSSARRSVMRPYYQGPLGDPLHFRLGPQDLEHITALYGKRTHLLATDGPHLAPEPHLRHRHGHTDGRWPSYAVDRCNTSFDAVAKIRGETFFFKGLSMWRVSRGGLVSGRAVSVRRLWGALPSSLPPLRAVLERHSDHAIIFISGSQFWLFKDLSLQDGYPQPLAQLARGGAATAGLQWDPELGAVWGDITETGQGGRGGGEGERRGGDEERDTWRELIKGGVNGITTENDGSIFLFKGHSYWKFPRPDSAPDEGYPRSLATDWLDCPHPSPYHPGDVPVTPPTGSHELREKQGEHGGADQIRRRDRDRMQYWKCPCMNRAAGGATLGLMTSILLPVLLKMTLTD